jgi:hypothetical protein
MPGAMWKTVASYLGKRKARCRANTARRELPSRSHKSKVSAGKSNEPAEVTEAPHRDSPTFFPVSLTGYRRFDRSQSLRRMVQDTPYTFLGIDQNLS